MSRLLFALSAALVLALPAHAAAAGKARAGQQHAVAIRGMAFVPATLSVHAGDAVVWKNEDVVPHTVTAADGSFDSKIIQPNASFRLVAKKRGTFPYVCTLHATMKGDLTVQ